ncbi:MAG: hypothetical protein H0T76_22795 [Nannocystis sp.]|nr:hypothetical protein [Nannocystis sp.]MBA3549311.1 hypothetical protein [Nannocystis sp.]
MRSITTLTLVLALGLTACPADKDDTDSATATATVTATMTPVTMTDGDTTTGGGTTTGGTTADISTTVTPPTTTDGTTAEPVTTTESVTTTDGTTVEPGTTTGGTTAEPGTTTGGGADESPYNGCASNADCGMGAICINSEVTGGQIKGSFCSPTCSGPGKICPDQAPGVATSQGPQCLFGPQDMPPTNCGIVCAVGMDECGPESDCEDLGQPPQMGVTLGICTVPP